MPTDPTLEFDLGPLSWVQGEIDQALTRGLESLAQFKANPADGTALKHARTHVHQAAGAIQMVGLDAVVAFTDELERQLSRMEELDPQAAAEQCDVVDRACRKLKIFLDELVNGAAPVPLKLYPEYEAMQAARGIKAAAPTDLFYPDLSPRAPRISQREVIPPNRMPSHLVKQRRLYQRGLLSWLRGDEAGAVQMRDAISGIEDITTQGSLRAFWWTVGAMYEGLVERGLDAGFGVKQLAARVDLQIRRVAEGSAKVADRLRREVLYFVAISAPVGPQVQAVQRAFKLSGLIPSAEVLSADVVRLQPILREAREQLAGAKDAWLKAASGRAENLGKLKQTLASVHAKAAEVHNGALMKLTAALVERLEKMPSSGVSEPVAMEYATALLLAESAFENYSSLSPDFPKQVDAMLRASTPRDRARRVVGRRADARRDEQARAGARAARAGGPRDPGQPPPHGAGARRVLPRQREARRPGHAREGQRADSRRAAHPGSHRGRSPARALRAADRAIRRSRHAGRQRGPGAPRGVALGPGLLHRGRRAAAPGPRSPHRAAHREAPGRSSRGGRARARLGRGGRRGAPRRAAAARGGSAQGAERRCRARGAASQAREPQGRRRPHRRPGPGRTGRRHPGRVRGGQCREAHCGRGRHRRHLGARAANLGGDAAPPRHGCLAVRQRAPRDLPLRGCGSARRRREESRDPRRQPR